ncbi:MAG: sigma 54-dependent transcriptional regulator, partial [Verrucomicrobiota bacterium]
NRDLWSEVRAGRFRQDLLARIHLWSFEMPSLAERREDIEPNLDFELQRFARKAGRKVRFNRESRRRFLDFAESPRASWSGNFRDLNAAIIRMATLAPAGRIREAGVEDEIQRLENDWAGLEEEEASDGLESVLGDTELEKIDPFDRHQLAYVVRVCRECRTLSEAGRRLFAYSRLQKSRPNDADRLRKYLQRFDLSWESLMEGKDVD